MSSTWCDSSLAFQEQLVRESIDSLAKDLDSIEQSVTLTAEVNNEARDEEGYDKNLPQKVWHFRQYLDRLRDGIRQLNTVERSQG